MQPQNVENIWYYGLLSIPLHRIKQKGTLADRLGNGLQNRVEQFDSARCLSFKRVISNIEVTLFLLYMGHKKGENKCLSLLYYNTIAL